MGWRVGAGRIEAGGGRADAVHGVPRAWAGTASLAGTAGTTGDSIITTGR